MIDNVFEYYEVILQDRIAKIQSVIKEYGVENFVLGYSGGKDSQCLSVLLDLALPNNKIPRLHINTGIELDLIEKFVLEQQKKDDRIIIQRPSKSIFNVTKEYGFPFKSKAHADMVKRYQNRSETNKKTIERYKNGKFEKSKFKCPSKLLYQFEKENNLKISDMCCIKMKEEPIKLWQNQFKKSIAITGMRSGEGGRRENSGCTTFRGGKLKLFNPLFPIDNEFISEFILKNNIELSDLYKEPYNFKRTGCVGCPFNIKIQTELDLLYKLTPNEYFKALAIWKPVYDEYIRIGYRLKYYPHLKGTQTKLDLTAMTPTGITER